MLKKNLLDLIEPHFHHDLSSDNYQIQTIYAKKLLSYADFEFIIFVIKQRLFLKNIKKNDKKPC